MAAVNGERAISSLVDTYLASELGLHGKPLHSVKRHVLTALGKQEDALAGNGKRTKKGKDKAKVKTAAKNEVKNEVGTDGKDEELDALQIDAEATHSQVLALDEIVRDLDLEVLLAEAALAAATAPAFASAPPRPRVCMPC